MLKLSSLPVLASNDFSSDQEVRWCPGCGDLSILAQMKQVLAGAGVAHENIVLVSGIGCAGRLPYYVDTFGMQGIQGRAPALATGLKLANPDLQVWVITGDGDGLSVGGNHLIHAMRRNVDIKILLFNNEVFGLTKGQYSPTARVGTRTKSSPEGSFETPLRPLSLALAAEATFVARTLDVDAAHLTEVLQRAAAHRGTAFVEIYQNCKVFNDGVFEYAIDKMTKADDTLLLEHGRPLVFGKDRNLGIALKNLEPEIFTLPGHRLEDLLVHNEKATEPTQAFLLSRMMMPDFPECFGIFRAVQHATFEEQFFHQMDQAKQSRLSTRLDDLFAGDDSWVIE